MAGRDDATALVISELKNFMAPKKSASRLPRFVSMHPVTSKRISESARAELSEPSGAPEANQS